MTIHFLRIFLLVLTSLIPFSNLLHAKLDELSENIYPRANAIIENHVEIHTIHSIKKIHSSYSYKINVLNSKAKYLLNLNAYYKSSSDKVTNIKVAYFDKYGKLIKKIKKREIDDISYYDGFSLVTDMKYKYIDFQPSSYPITIEASYDITSTNTLGIPPFNPIQGYNIAITKYSYEVVNKSIEIIETSERNFKGWEINKSGKIAYQIRNQEPIIKEEYSLSLIEISPLVVSRINRFNFETHEGYFSNWQEYGDWIKSEFLQKENDLEDSALEEYPFLLDSTISKKVKVKKLYNQIQHDTRYINITLKDGGLNPMNSNDVHKLKYGDCKALSYYMYSILKKVNIDSEYIIVQANSNHQTSINDTFASVFEGNHIILKVPLEKEDIWLDCTSKTIPFNFLGDFTDNRKVISIGKTTTIQKTPIYDINLNKTESISFLKIKENKTIDIISTIKNSGLKIQDPVNTNLLEKEKQNEKIRTKYFTNIKSLKITDYKLKENKDSIFVVEDIKGESDHSISKVGDYILLNQSIVSFVVPILIKRKKRKNPIKITRNSKQTEELIISIPTGYVLAEIPIKTEIKTEFGYINIKYEITKSSITIKRELIIKKGQYDPNRYKSIRSFFQKVIKTEKEQIAFKIK